MSSSMRCTGATRLEATAAHRGMYTLPTAAALPHQSPPPPPAVPRQQRAHRPAGALRRTRRQWGQRRGLLASRLTYRGLPTAAPSRLSHARWTTPAGFHTRRIHTARRRVPPCRARRPSTGTQPTLPTSGRQRHQPPRRRRRCQRGRLSTHPSTPPPLQPPTRPPPRTRLGSAAVTSWARRPRGGPRAAVVAVAAAAGVRAAPH